jgi:protoporphyrinogen IX oxidase
MDGQGYLWIKAFHIVFVAAWFAGLFYLPRIFVNLAMENNPAATSRLLLMARKLYRFTTILAIPAIVLGAAIVVLYKIGLGSENGWFHVKALLVLITIAYHVLCGKVLRKFEAGQNTHTHTYYRWFNEAPVVLLTVIVIMVVVKPF